MDIKLLKLFTKNDVDLGLKSTVQKFSDNIGMLFVLKKSHFRKAHL